jgi:hypothetical protein
MKTLHEKQMHHEEILNISYAEREAKIREDSYKKQQRLE